MSNIDKQYQKLLQDILDNGLKKNDRTGTGTISVFGRQIRHNMSEGFPLLTTKKMAWKSIVTELLWFLRGDTHIKFLIDNDCNIWNGDAYQGYLKRFSGGLEPASKERFIEMIKNGEESRVDANGWRIGELGPIYGKQWRRWETDNNDAPRYEHWKKDIDQIANLISDLKTNPDSRRLMVNAWNVGELDEMVLPPCHYGFQLYTRELSLKERCDAYMKWSDDPKCLEWKCHIENEMGWDYEKPEWVFKEVKEQLDKAEFPTRAISLMYNARSQDVPLGTPFNIASYALLLEIIAKMVNMVPDELITNMGDCHIYLNQIDGVKEQITREPLKLPTLVISNQVNFNEGVDEFLNSCFISDFQVEGYQSHPTIPMPLSN